MGRIQEAFSNKSGKDKLFVPYLCAGDPDMEMSRDLALAVETAGADILELGIPFSDPLADGPTIQQATQRSLDNGTRMRQVFQLVESIREDSDIPIVLMTYYNPVFRYGEELFIDQARSVGADGVLVVDLPPEEGLEFYRQAPEKGLETALLATPTTPDQRVRDLSELATGYLYYVLVTGVTGVRTEYDPELADQIERVGQQSRRPTVVGFGISDVEAIDDYLDPIEGIVAGSYLIEAINENVGNRDRVLEEVRHRARSLADPLHRRAEGAESG